MCLKSAGALTRLINVVYYVFSYALYNVYMSCIVHWNKHDEYHRVYALYNVYMSCIVHWNKHDEYHGVYALYNVYMSCIVHWNKYDEYHCYFFLLDLNDFWHSRFTTIVNYSRHAWSTFGANIG